MSTLKDADEIQRLCEISLHLETSIDFNRFHSLYF